MSDKGAVKKRSVPKQTPKNEASDQRLIFRFNRARDFFDSRWGLNKISQESFHMLLTDYLPNMETRTLGEVLQHKASVGTIKGVSDFAKSSSGRGPYRHEFKKLLDILEEEYQDDTLCEWRVTYSGRIWGIMEQNFFYVLLWDPNHELWEKDTTKPFIEQVEEVYQPWPLHSEEVEGVKLALVDMDDRSALLQVIVTTEEHSVLLTKSDVED